MEFLLASTVNSKDPWLSVSQLLWIWL